MIDISLLMNTLSVQTKSNEQQDMINYITEFVSNIGLIDKMTTDDYGNIYIVKGLGKNGYRCIVSHIDTVHDRIEDRKVYQHDDVLFAFGKHTVGYNKGYAQCGVNGDDSVGVYLCLSFLFNEDDIKVVFFQNEEIGKLGSKACNISFFDDCNLVLQPDRKGNSDFIDISSGIKLCSDTFLTTIKPVLEKYGYSIKTGVSTDVDALKKNGLAVCCANVSCGYYNPHTDSEIVSISDVEKCYSLISEIFNDYGNVRHDHKYVYVPPVYNFVNNVTSTIKAGFLSLIHDNSKAVLCEGLRSFGKTFRYGNEYVYVTDKPICFGKCPECGKETLYFLPNEGYFMCTSKECHSLKYLPKVLNSMVVTDANGKDQFRYNVFNDCWLRKEDAKFDKTKESWVIDWSKIYNDNCDVYDYQ